ncbi:MAG: tyrosine--tRNA ligase [Clostridia bacterium]|jgi:tyrosyl-tRNA synthetase|nr:tyrosine--tRNA ligase [Clostridia bacterium]
MGLLQEFKDRGMLAQITNEEAVKELFEKEKISFYIGFDPTADSLHIGHFIQMKIMAHMQRAGHRPVVIFGGGTAMIGDPSGKNDMRKMMTRETIQYNVDRFKEQMAKFIDISDGKALFVDNADWLLQLNYVDFIRDIGKHFNINRMLAAECYKARLEKGGLTFLEFNYMLMQSYDFYKLYKDYGVKMELGGDDQWSNIIGGVELIRKMTGDEVYGVTFNLLTNSEGKKMGKTEKGAVWLDAEKTSPYEFYQYWRNIGDADVIKCMKMLTFMPLEEIAEYEKLEGSDLNRAKEKLAYELTLIIHGKEEADKADAAAKALFGGNGNTENMPTTTLADADFTDGEIALLQMLVMSGIAKSRNDARTLVTQGSVSVGDEKITDLGKKVSKTDIGDGLIVRKGKKVYHKFILG